MTLPPETENLITSLLERVKSDPNHLITAPDRLRIYRSLGPSRVQFSEKDIKEWQSLTFVWKKHPFDFLDDASTWVKPAPVDENSLIDSYKTRLQTYSKADHVLNWLAILTVEHVLFIWEDWDWKLYIFSNRPKRNARKIINTAKRVLNKTIPFKKAFDLFCEDFNLGLNVDKGVPYHVYSVYEAAYYAFDFIVTYDNSYWVKFGVTNDNYDEAEYSQDFVMSSIKAYTSIDPNPPGEYKLWPLKFDLEKRLEFWVWWLNEAIPQAWELAHISENQTDSVKKNGTAKS
jgi:hypothetical protein